MNYLDTVNSFTDSDLDKEALMTDWLVKLSDRCKQLDAAFTVHSHSGCKWGDWLNEELLGAITAMYDLRCLIVKLHAYTESLFEDEMIAGLGYDSEGMKAVCYAAYPDLELLGETLFDKLPD